MNRIVLTSLCTWASRFPRADTKKLGCAYFLSRMIVATADLWTFLCPPPLQQAWALNCQTSSWSVGFLNVCLNDGWLMPASWSNEAWNQMSWRQPPAHALPHHHPRQTPGPWLALRWVRFLAGQSCLLARPCQGDPHPPLQDNPLPKRTTHVFEGAVATISQPSLFQDLSI